MQKRVRALESPPPLPGGSQVADKQRRPKSAFFGDPSSPPNSTSTRSNACTSPQNRPASVNAKNPGGGTASTAVPLGWRKRHVSDDSPPPVQEVINLVSDSDVPEENREATKDAVTAPSAISTQINSQEIIIISDSEEDTLENGGPQDESTERVSVSPSRPIRNAMNEVQEGRDLSGQRLGSTSRDASSAENSEKGQNVPSQLGYSARVPEEGDDEESDDEEENAVPLSQLYNVTAQQEKKNDASKPLTPVSPLDERLFSRSGAEKRRSDLSRFWYDSSDSAENDNEEVEVVTPPQPKSRPHFRRLRRTADWSSSDDDVHKGVDREDDEEEGSDEDDQLPVRSSKLDSPIRRSPRFSQVSSITPTRKSPRFSQPTAKDTVEFLAGSKTFAIAGVTVSDDSSDEKAAGRKSMSKAAARLSPRRASPRQSTVKDAERLRALHLLGYIEPPSTRSTDEEVTERPRRRRQSRAKASSARKKSPRTRSAGRKRARYSSYEHDDFVVSDGEGEESEDSDVELVPRKRTRVSADDSDDDILAQPSFSSESESEPRTRTAQDDLDDERAAQVKEEMGGNELPRGLQDPIICYICRLQGIPKVGTPRNGWRDGYIQPVNNFSVNVQKGIYGVRMTVPYCLAHTAGDQNRYIQQLEWHVTTTQGEAQEEPSPAPRAANDEVLAVQEDEHSDGWREYAEDEDDEDDLDFIVPSDELTL